MNLITGYQEQMPSTAHQHKKQRDFSYWKTLMMNLTELSVHPWITLSKPSTIVSHLSLQRNVNPNTQHSPLSFKEITKKPIRSNPSKSITCDKTRNKSLKDTNSAISLASYLMDPESNRFLANIANHSRKDLERYTGEVLQGVCYK